MAKVKVQGNTISGTAEDITKAFQKASERLEVLARPEIEITGAALVKGFCNYTYKLTAGITAGDDIKREGYNMVHQDMTEAFKALNAHLAVVTEYISPSEIDIDNLPDPYDEGLKGKTKQLAVHLARFCCASFKIEGTGEKQGVVLTGAKELQNGEVIKLTTYKVMWEDNYPFINELRIAVDQCCREVMLYMEGKTAPKMVQTEIFTDEQGEPSGHDLE